MDYAAPLCIDLLIGEIADRGRR